MILSSLFNTFREGMIDKSEVNKAKETENADRQDLQEATIQDNSSKIKNIEDKFNEINTNIGSIKNTQDEHMKQILVNEQGVKEAQKSSQIMTEEDLNNM
tara:strand:- start:378 stop:677 length:300 start_codon:yes stop_codon:yes gene_type:complete